MNESDLKTLINDHPFGIAELTQAGNYLFFNEKERLFRGLSWDEMQTTSVFDFFDEADRLRLKMVFEQCIVCTHNDSHFFNYQQGTRDFQMRLSKSTGTGIISSLVETTPVDVLKSCFLEDQKHIKQLNSALDAANIGVWEYYPQEGRLIVNKTWVTQKKYQDKDFREDNQHFSNLRNSLSKWFDIIHPDDIEATVALFNDYLKGNYDRYEAQFRIKSGEGDWMWISGVGRTSQLDADGRAIKVSGVHVVITKSREFEEYVNKISNVDL